MHKPRLTPKLTEARCEYLRGQWRRGHLDKYDEIEDKARKNLPVRENEVKPLVEAFVELMREKNDVIACPACGLLTDCVSEYDGEEYCYDCADRFREEDE